MVPNQYLKSATNPLPASEQAGPYPDKDPDVAVTEMKRKNVALHTRPALDP